jgi:hypothetical protein
MIFDKFLVYEGSVNFFKLAYLLSKNTILNKIILNTNVSHHISSGFFLFLNTYNSNIQKYVVKSFVRFL